MYMDEFLHFLKKEIQLRGALRPEAWDVMVSLLRIDELKAGESVVRKSGSISFITTGLLKEYDVIQGRKPKLINFMSTGEFFYSNTYKRGQYLKANHKSQVISLDFDALLALYSKFPELKAIYDLLCYGYDEQLSFRHSLMELSAAERIASAKNRYRSVFPYLKKKDIANYLHISYNYLLSTW